MTSLLSMPDELLQLIALQAIQEVHGLPLYCRIASTCTRLWILQLSSPVDECMFRCQWTLEGGMMRRDYI